MKTLELKETTIPRLMSEPQGAKLSYRDLLETVLKQDHGQGFVFEELRMRLKILDQIEAADGVLRLEDTEAVSLQSYVNKTRWALVHRDIVQFCQDVADMPGEDKGSK